MFVRRKPNTSGTSSVFVVDKSRGTYRVIKTFGVGRTEAELELLEQRANQYIREVTGLSRSLFNEEPDVSTSDLSNRQLPEVIPELVYGRLYDKLGFGRLQNEVFRHLVIAFLLSPDNRLHVVDYLKRHFGKNHGINSLYRMLDNLCCQTTKKRAAVGKDIKRKVENISLARTRETQKGQVDTIFCNLLPIRFETGKAKLIATKHGKYTYPPFYLGLLTVSGGNPVGYEIYEDAVMQDNIFIAAIQQLNKRFSPTCPIVIADISVLTQKHLEALENANYKYIAGIDPKNETEEIRQAILRLKLKEDSTTIIPLNEERMLVVSKSADSAAKDRNNRERGLQRLLKKIKTGTLTPANINNRGYNKYLKLKGRKKIVIDRDKCKTDAVWDGIKGCLTNAGLCPDEVLINHEQFCLIEHSIRLNRLDLHFRPVNNTMQNRIETMMCIYYTAYIVIKELERLLKASGTSITLKQAQDLTSPKDRKKHDRHIDEQQVELCRIVEKACASY